MPTRSPNPVLKKIQGADSWRFASDRVEACLTPDGGHLAPVTFKLPHGKIQPFSVAHWGTEKLDPATPPLLRKLRGDFFCFPFGANTTAWRGERHPLHGETAGMRWKGRGLERNGTGVTFHAEMSPTVRRGRVTKQIQLRHGETNVYCRHELNGFSGPMCVGHHATLRFPGEAGSGALAFSAWRHGQVFPGQFETPEIGGYSSLKPGARFKRLDRVPASDGSFADLTRYPARAGFEDLVMLSSAAAGPFAWSTATFAAQRYLWFGLKDPRVLASTVLWHSNGGRHYPPWNGRHRHTLGIEEVTAFFHAGLAESVKPNSISRQGIPTSIQLQPNRPFVVNYVMGVVPIPRGFDRVQSVGFSRDGMRFISASGKSVAHRVDLTFFA